MTINANPLVKNNNRFFLIFRGSGVHKSQFSQKSFPMMPKASYNITKILHAAPEAYSRLACRSRNLLRFCRQLHESSKSLYAVP